METLTPWQQPELRPTPALEHQLERQILAPARSVGEDLSLVAITEPPPPVSIMHPPQGGTWIAARHDRDPVAAARGALHAPEAEIERLRRLHEAGMRPDVILVGHQLPGRWQPGDPVPPAYLPGEAATVNRVLAAQSSAVAFGLGLVQAAAGIGGGLGQAAAGGVARLGETVAALDPVILGGTREPETGLIGWVFLGGWDEQPSR
ncbi:MAG TPA: hypothetical protein VN522_08625 [Solirubrobacterales bacterium]|nr:hypothetical protein [Solirubrobacterales bacterium]